MFYLTRGLFGQERPIIKAASPNFMLLLLLGCFICFFALPFLSVDADPSAPTDLSVSSCRIYPFLFGFGFVAMYGSLLVKSYEPSSPIS
jgi:hypothetical protein